MAIRARSSASMLVPVEKRMMMRATVATLNTQMADPELRIVVGVRAVVKVTVTPTWPT